MSNKRHSASFYSLSTSSDIYLSQNNSIDSIIDHSNELPNIKILFIGDANVGKTAMILRFCNELPTRGQLRALNRSISPKSPSSSPVTTISPQNNNLLRRNIKHNNTKKKDKDKRKRYSSTDFDEFNKRRSLIFTNNYSSLFNEQINEEEPTHKFDNDDEIMLYTQSTIGVDIKTRLINIDNQFFNCTFWDTAGQERYQNAIVPSLYKNCNGIILTYDITNFQSFQDCFHIWLMESLKYIPREQLTRCRIYLVGNKIDLYPERQVTHQNILKAIYQVEKTLNVKIYGNFEVTCQWGEIIDNIMNSIITDLVSNGCYQHIRMKFNNNDKILPDAEEEVDTDEMESFYSVGSEHDKIINLTDPLISSQPEYSCCG